MFPVVITQDQLLAQNARLIQQIQEQQKMINLQNMLAQGILQQREIPPEPKKVKKSYIEKISSQASLRETAIPLQEIKGHVKNAYIKKITSLLSVEGQELLNDEELQDDLNDSSSSEVVQPKYRLSGLLGSQNDLLSSDAKNKRLRKSAKKSRLRKKVYLKLLEKKVSELDSKIQYYKDGTKSSFEFLSALLSSHPILNSMIIGNSAAMEAINENLNPEQIQLALDSYLMRYGMSGIKRKDYLRYCVKNIQRNFLKGNYGLQLLSFDKDQQQTYNQEFNQYVEIFKQLSKVEDESQTYKILPTVEKLLKHRNTSQEILAKLNQDMKKIKTISHEIEETMTQITQFEPTKYANLIRLVEEDKSYNRGLI